MTVFNAGRFGGGRFNGGRFSGRAGVSAILAATFGALTAIGAGATPLDVPDGTYGSFTVSGGLVSPNATPVTAGTYSAGAATITVVAGEASARTQAEFITAAAGGNRIVRMRPITYPDWTLNNLTLTNVTLAAQAGALFSAVRGDNTGGLTIDGLVLFNSNPTLLDGTNLNNAAIRFAGTDAGQITVTNCAIDCDTTPATNRLGGITIRGRANATVTDCELTGFRFGVQFYECGSMTATGNNFQRFSEDCIRDIGCLSAVVTGNTATLGEGFMGRRVTGATITGTVEVGDEVWSGDKTNPDSRGGLVVAIGAGTVDIDSNNAQIPVSSATSPLIGPNGSVAYTGVSNAYDGRHQDFFQAYNYNAAITADLAITVSENFVRRSTAFTPGVIYQETMIQGVLIQDNPIGRFDPVTIERNVMLGTSGRAISVYGGDNVRIALNTVLEIEVRAQSANPTISAENCNTVDVLNNVGVQIDTATGNSGVTTSQNQIVTRAEYAAQFPALPSVAPYGALANYAPAIGSTVEIAFAGALDPDATYRGEIPPPPPPENLYPFTSSPLAASGVSFVAVTDGWQMTTTFTGIRPMAWNIDGILNAGTLYRFKFTALVNGGADDLRARGSSTALLSGGFTFNQSLIYTAGAAADYDITFTAVAGTDFIGLSFPSAAAPRVLTVTNLRLEAV